MRRNERRWTTIASILVGAAALIAWTSVCAQTLDRVRSSNSLKLGYEPDSRPFSFKTDQGAPTGYAVSLCMKLADNLKTELGLAQLNVEWVPLAGDAKANAFKDGTVDMICGAERVTLTRGREASFSIPIFPSGTGVVRSYERAPGSA